MPETKRKPHVEPGAGPTPQWLRVNEASITFPMFLASTNDLGKGEVLTPESVFPVKLFGGPDLAASISFAGSKRSAREGVIDISRGSDSIESQDCDDVAAGPKISTGVVEFGLTNVGIGIIRVPVVQRGWPMLPMSNLLPPVVSDMD